MTYELPTIYNSTIQAEDKHDFESYGTEHEIFHYQLHAMIGKTKVKTGEIEVYLSCFGVDEYTILAGKDELFKTAKELQTFLKDYGAQIIFKTVF